MSTHLGKLTPIANTAIPLSFICWAKIDTLSWDLPSVKIIRIWETDEFLPPRNPCWRMCFRARPVFVRPPLKQEKRALGKLQAPSFVLLTSDNSLLISIYNIYIFKSKEEMKCFITMAYTYAHSIILNSLTKLIVHFFKGRNNYSGSLYWKYNFLYVPWY